MKKLKNFVRVLFAMILALTLTNTQTVEAASDTVVIYEVYGGGGNSGATFKNNYIILKNISTENLKLDGLYVHRGSAKAWQDKIALTGNLKPGQYYVVEAQEGFNKSAKALPRKDIEAKDMGIGAKNFAIALTRDGQKPSAANTIDLVGVGTALFREASPSVAASNNGSIRRINDTDTDDNAKDFDYISLNESSLDYLLEETSKPEVTPKESTVTINPNGGQVNEDLKTKIVKNGEAYNIDFEGNYKFYKDGYHFDGFDVEGELEDKDGNRIDYIKRADPFTDYYPKSDVTLKVRWKVMEGGQIKAYVKREDGTAFSGIQYKLYIKGTDTEERRFPYGVKREAQTHKMSLLQLKNDTYTLRVEGLDSNEFIKEVNLREEKYTQNQAITKVELKEKDKAEIEIKFDSHFIAPEVNFDVIIGKKPVEESYTVTLTGEGVNEITVPGFTKKTEIKLKDVNREGYKFLGWKVEGTLFDAEGNPVTGLITNFDQSYYPESDVVFTAVWEEEEKVTVNFAFNKDIAGVTVPEAQKVKVGSEITLPEVSPIVKDGYSFLGWAKGNNKYATPNLNPGDTITVDEDTTIMGIWEGAYGKVSLTFHTGQFIDDNFENRDKITKLEDDQLAGGGFSVENQQSGQITEGKNSSSKGKISINNGLVKGTYTLNVTAPEGYEIVRIARDTGSNGVIEIENGSTISLPRPEAPFNLTMVDSIYVEVKEKEEEKVTVNFEFDKNIDGAKLPDPINVPVGTEIKLPSLDEEVLGDYSFMGWELDKAYPNKADANPGDTFTVTEDMTVKGYWEGRYGRFAVHFHEGDYFENKDNLQTLTEGFGFATINPRDNTRLEGVLAGENSKNPYFLTPNRANGGGLTKGDYDFEFKIPEGYKIVSIKKHVEGGGLEEVSVGERIDPYWYPFNLTMARDVYVQVEKEEPKIELPQGLYIYEIYGGGGLQQSYYANDYVILQNKSDTDIDLAGINLHVSKQWRPEYAYNIPLSGTIKANDYFVIKAGAGFKSGEQKELPRVDLDLSGGKLYQNDFDYQAIGLALTKGPEEPNEKNTIDKVGTYYNNQYIVKPAVSPHVDRSIRRIAYDDVNKTDFEKVSHRPYVEGTADHREPLWYLRDSQEEKVTVKFKHNVSLENNEVPAEQNVWSGTKITLPEVKEEDKYEFKGWDIDGDGQADKEASEEFEVKEDVTITGIWEEKAPEVKTINFVVDSEKGIATGDLSVELAEGENPLEKAPKVEAKEGYKFVEWKASEDRLTYTAIFEEVKTEEPQGPKLNENLRFTLDSIDGDKMVLISSHNIDKVLVKTRSDEEIEATIEQVDKEIYTLSLCRPLEAGEKVIIEIIVNNEISKAIRTRV
ncbi:InlB B-repeat-containing protein [Anaerococcus sp. Marseille-Q7828]|uniref:InlB B-repeat-containing protein n=1 Tax=Anaerococcus sp. Marseille-Q7828 TaxID=3036300 RepID=UPI0024ACAD25|nr:InlB B-repeat-containing protein [Anaerococcus sp. Marseille-Q7828]